MREVVVGVTCSFDDVWMWSGYPFPFWVLVQKDTDRPRVVEVHLDVHIWNSDDVIYVRYVCVGNNNNKQEENNETTLLSKIKR